MAKSTQLWKTKLTGYFNGLCNISIFHIISSKLGIKSQGPYNKNTMEKGNNLNPDEIPKPPYPHQDKLKTSKPDKNRIEAGIILEAEMEKRDRLRVEKKNEEETKKQEELVAELLKNYNKGDYLEILALDNESKKREGKEKSDKKIYKD